MTSFQFQRAQMKMVQKTQREEEKDLLHSCCTFQLQKLEETPYLYNLEYL